VIATSQQLLYVSTELDTWETSTPGPDQDQICERCGYRRLDPEYYAWLRHRMEVAKQARQRGRLAAAQYQELRQRFNAVHFWAVAHLAEDMLLAAVDALSPKAYQPPQIQEWEPIPEPPASCPPVHLFPAAGDWPFTESVSPEAIAQVDAIREQALSLGWSEADLYQNRGRYRFPVGGDYGVVCFLHSDARVGEVTAEWIEIINARGTGLRFHSKPAMKR